MESPGVPIAKRRSSCQGTPALNRPATGQSSLSKERNCSIGPGYRPTPATLTGSHAMLVLVYEERPTTLSKSSLATQGSFSRRVSRHPPKNTTSGDAQGRSRLPPRGRLPRPYMMSTLELVGSFEKVPHDLLTQPSVLHRSSMTSSFPSGEDHHIFASHAVNTLAKKNSARAAAPTSRGT